METLLPNPTHVRWEKMYRVSEWTKVRISPAVHVPDREILLLLLLLLFVKKMIFCNFL